MPLLPTLTRCVTVAFLCCAASAAAWARSLPGNPSGAANVNSRYTVERVDVAPMGLDKISAPLRDRLQQLVGVRFDASLLEDAAARLKRELRNREVTTQVSRGSAPNQVAVTFQVELQNRTFEAQLTEFLYHSKEQLGMGIDLVYRGGSTRVHAGALSDNDDLIERSSGVRGGVERSLAGGLVRVGLEAGARRSNWNRSTLAATLPGSTYRQREAVQPTTTLQFSKLLTLQLGVSVERLEVNSPAVRHEFSSAAFGTLRFQRRWGLDSELRQRLEAAYGVRTGMPSLASDFSFTRHHWMARYGLRQGNEEILASFQAGLLSGRAPLNERFIGGNSRILRGWNRFDLTPAGADRLANVSFDYRWRKLRLSYDAGSVRGLAGLPDSSWRHSAGIGVSNNLWSGLSFLVAFPLREGRIEPVFIAGMNF